jgi:hypothetical protein
VRGANVAAALALVALGALLRPIAGCSERGEGTGTGAGGGDGGGGGAAACPDGLSPLFTLRVRGPEDALPLDLALDVSWSAGDEPTVSVDDPDSYGTSESNVICAVVAPTTDGEGGGPAATTGGEGGGSPERGELLCELWTSGPTRVRVQAAGFVPIDETLAPETLDGCDRPVPSEVPLELVVEEEPEDEDE